MVDAITAKAIGTEQSVSRVAAANPAPAPDSASATPRKTQGTTAAIAQLSGVGKELASTPPVDASRVAQIKRAIETDTFPLLPSTIADRLIALRLEWKSK